MYQKGCVTLQSPNVTQPFFLIVWGEKKFAIWMAHWTRKTSSCTSAPLLSHPTKQKCTAATKPLFFPSSVLQGSSQRHGEYPPLSLPGGRLHHNWTLAGRGPPPLPGFPRGPSGAQHRLPVCPASSHPLRVLHRGTDTLCLHGRADPASGRCVCLSAKSWGFSFCFVCVFVRSRRRTAELHPCQSRTSVTVQ